MHPGKAPPAEIAIIARRNVTNDTPQDYYLLTEQEFPDAKLVGNETTAGALAPFRYTGLEALIEVVQRRLVQPTP